MVDKEDIRNMSNQEFLAFAKANKMEVWSAIIANYAIKFMGFWSATIFLNHAYELNLDFFDIILATNAYFLLRLPPQSGATYNVRNVT